MLDKNVVILEGVAGDDVKFDRATNGKEYCTFSLCMNAFNKELGDEDEMTRSTTFIRVMVFNNRKAKLVDYLRRVGFHRGQRVNIFGMLASHKSEYKGITYIQNNVIVRDITIVQTKTNNKFKKQKNEEKESVPVRTD